MKPFLLPLFLTTALCSSYGKPAEAQPPIQSLGKIVFIGDSITAGVGVKDRPNYRYSTVTTRLLKEKHPDVVEINLAQSGRALCQQRPDYAESILKREPDAVVIQWGVNDQYWGFSVAEFVAKYDQLVQTLRKAKPNMPIVLTTLVADFRWEENLDLWIGQANIAIQEIAARYKCRVAYIHRGINHDRQYYADTIHPNNAGAEVMAKAIVAAFAAPPLSSSNLALQFDQGREVRFMRYVFSPQREGIEPKWTHVSQLSRSGMQINTEVPISIRTPSLYKNGTTYRIRIRNQCGKEIHSFEQKSSWHRMLQFKVEPKDLNMPLDIEITAVE